MWELGIQQENLTGKKLGNFWNDRTSIGQKGTASTERTWTRISHLI